MSVAALLVFSSLLFTFSGCHGKEVSVVDRVIAHDSHNKCDELGKISENKKFLVRTYMSPAHKKAAYLIAKWMQQAGMKTWIDDIRNVHGFIPGTDNSLPPLYIGSHYDTAIDAGRYDGQLGIVTGIAAVKATLLHVLDKQGRLDQVVNTSAPEVSIPASVAETLLKHPVHVVAFSDEEGIRFQSTFLGSRALAGTVSKYGMLSATGKDGLSIEEVLEMEGVDGVEAALQELAVAPSGIRGYVEVHIEQGPVLEKINKPLAVVSAIAGQKRLLVTVRGDQGHAGTVPMTMRADSLTAAANMITMIEQRCGGGPGHESGEGALPIEDEDMLVCTVGEITIHPAASNVIPGSAVFSIDIRTRSNQLLNQVRFNLTESIQEICSTRNVRCEVELKHEAATVNSDIELSAALKTAIKHAQEYEAAAKACDDDKPLKLDTDSGNSLCSGNMHSPSQVPVMVSGAGHDAMAVAEVAKVAMMFVRCRGGLSHTPLEHVTKEDAAVATRALHELLKMKLL